jgi:mannose-6-phosphate isomerase-like protein (cupin superfamily)
MAKEALASEDLAKKFATEKETPYTRWVKAEGLDIIPALYVRNLRTVDVKPWARRGGNAVFVNHDASRVSNDSYVMEIPPGKTLEPHRQLYEEMILVLEGRGSTTVWNNEGKRITFEWKAGSLFAIPLNAWQCAPGDQSLRGSRLHLRLRPRLQESLQWRAGLFQRQG